MSPCPHKLYHWGGFILVLLAFLFCENPTRIVSRLESWERGQNRSLVRCSLSFSRDPRILEMTRPWDMNKVQWQPEPMRQSVCTLDGRTGEVGLFKPFRAQRIMSQVSPRCWMLNGITGFWFCLNVFALMLWFFHGGIRTCSGFL